MFDCFGVGEHRCTVSCPTVCGVTTPNVMYVEATGDSNAVVFKLVVYEQHRFHEAAEGPLPHPARLPGVQLGQRWREYQCRR